MTKIQLETIDYEKLRELKKRDPLGYIKALQEIKEFNRRRWKETRRAMHNMANRIYRFKFKRKKEVMKDV